MTTEMSSIMSRLPEQGNESYAVPRCQASPGFATWYDRR